jgi:hypothetical protein
MSLAIDHMNLFLFFLNKTTNGGSEDNLVYSNARELIVKNRRKGITHAKRDYETKNKHNHHSFASITVPVAKDSV